MAELAFKMHKELWPDLKEESGVDFQARTMPHLEVCLTEDDIIEQHQEFERWSVAEGFTARWLQPEDVRKLEPRIAEDVLAGILLENVGMLASYRYTPALAQAAERHGEPTFIHYSVMLLPL